ncbi:MAG: hypothetical protein AABZ41_09395 [Bacteroidota bacterium]
MKTILVTVCFLAVSCGPGGGLQTGGMRDAITAEEIAAANAFNAYDAVTKLRPLFLQQRGSSPPVVYVDNVRYGTPATLRDISTTNIQRIEYIGASDATTRFGTGHSGGVIMVSMKSQ